jgi:predicted secreted protein
MRTLLRSGLLLLSLASISTSVWCEETPLTYGRIDINVDANREVENDTLVATMYAQREGSNTAQLSTEVNQVVSQAVKQAKSTPGIKVQTMGYNTNPIYNKRILTGWRVRQDIRLESQDSAALSKLIGDLQKQLGVDGISYTISPEKRRTTEELLMAEGISAFKRRAQLITKEMGHTRYRLVDMQVNSSRSTPYPIMMSPGALMAERSMAAPAPALEAGTGQVQINISGTIELVTE